MVYGKVYKQKLQQYAITKHIGNASACALGPCQCIPGPVFRPPQLIKTGPGDEATSCMALPYTCMQFLYCCFLYLHIREGYQTVSLRMSITKHVK